MLSCPDPARYFNRRLQPPPLAAHERCKCGMTFSRAVTKVSVRHEPPFVIILSAGWTTAGRNRRDIPSDKGKVARWYHRSGRAARSCRKTRWRAMKSILSHRLPVRQNARPNRGSSPNRRAAAMSRAQSMRPADQPLFQRIALITRRPSCAACSESCFAMPQAIDLSLASPRSAPACRIMVVSAFA